MSRKKVNYEVELLLEHKTLIILTTNKIIVCKYGSEKKSQFEESKQQNSEEHSALQPFEVAQGPVASKPLTHCQERRWQFPPPLQTPHVDTDDENNMLRPIGNERVSFRRLRKNIGGRWKKLVQKNPEQYSIPPELKPQLKQIYVY